MKTLFTRSSQRKLIATLIALVALTLSLSSVSAQTGSGGVGKAAQPGSTQYFQDVAVGSFWYNYTAALYQQGITSGYPCGSAPAGACVPPGNLPYYLPNDNVSRGQMAKFISLTRSQPGLDIRVPSNDTTNVRAVFLRNDKNSGLGLDSYVTGNGTSYNYGGVSAAVAGTAVGNVYSVGILGYSTNSIAGVFDTGNGAAQYGLKVEDGGMLITGTSPQVDIDGDTTVHGNLTVYGSKTGYVVDIMRNDGNADLHPGDVVALGGNEAAPAILGTIPVASAVTAGKAYDSAVLGVVDEQWLPGDAKAVPDSKQAQGKYDTNTTAIHPGAYMSVVTLGAYKAVKVNASNGPIHVGDLLTTSAVAGEAMRVGDKDKLAAFGAVIGKAMGNLDSGSGYIPVMVTLR